MLYRARHVQTQCLKTVLSLSVLAPGHLFVSSANVLKCCRGHTPTPGCPAPQHIMAGALSGAELLTSWWLGSREKERRGRDPSILPRVPPVTSLSLGPTPKVPPLPTCTLGWEPLLQHTDLGGHFRSEVCQYLTCWDCRGEWPVSCFGAFTSRESIAPT
jgi:hypothetical protein